MPGRLTSKKLEITCWTAAQIAMSDWANQEREIAKAKLTLDAAADAAAREFAERTAYAHERAKELKAALKKFATKHHQEFRTIAEGGEGRTRIFAGVELGFQMGKPTVEIQDEEAALAFLQQHAALKSRFLEFLGWRIKRDELKAAYRDKRERVRARLVRLLRRHGITVEQKEEFILKAETGTPGGQHRL